MNHSPMSGNPVEIGDGCATVTDDKLPRPLAAGPGRRERGSSPKSGYRSECARQGPADAVLRCSAKSRMRPGRRSVAGGAWMPSFSTRRGLQAFVFALPTPHWSPCETSPQLACGGQTKDQSMLRKMLVRAALSGVLFLSPLTCPAAGFSETFTSDPAPRGWFATGTTNLFAWAAADGTLAATWDSRQPNSYFAKPLGLVLTRTNDFCLVFDLRLANVTPGINPAKTSASFQVAIGLIRLEDATAPGFRRGSGYESPNLCDFSFFPDPGGEWQYGPSLTAAMIDGTGFNWSWGGFSPSGLSTGDVFRVTMAYSAGDAMLRTEILRNGESFLSMAPATLKTPFTDFQLDHLAVCSYNDAGQFPGYEGSLLAHGSVDNVTFLPVLPVAQLRAVRRVDGYGVAFLSQEGWLYTLERKDGSAWTPVASSVALTGGNLILTDPNPTAAMSFYRVKAMAP